MGVLIVACTEAFSSLPPHVPSCERAFQELDQDANKLITRSDTNGFDGGLKKAVMEELQLANGTINFAQFAVKYCEGQNIAPKYAARWSSFLYGGQYQDSQIGPSQAAGRQREGPYTRCVPCCPCVTYVLDGNGRYVRPPG